MITAFLSVALLTLAGCGGTTSVSDEAGNNEVKPKEVSQPKAPIAKSEIKECLPGCEAFEEGEGLLSKGMCQDACWTDEAEVRKDITICDEKVSKDNALMQIGCRLNVATATLDPKYCATIDDGIMTMGCYSELAVLKKDPTICENIPAGITRSICLDSLEEENY